MQEDQQITGFCLKTEKSMEQENENDTNINWSAWNSPLKVLEKTTGVIRNQKMNRNRRNNIIIEIGQNTKRSPGNLSRLSVTLIPVRDHK